MSDDALKKWRALASGLVGLVAVVFAGATLVALMVHYVKHGVTSSLSGLAPFVTSIAWPGVGFTCAWLLLRSGAIAAAVAAAIGRLRKAGPLELAESEIALGLGDGVESGGVGVDPNTPGPSGGPNHDLQVWAAYVFGVRAMFVAQPELSVERWNKNRASLANTVRGTSIALRIDAGSSRELLKLLDTDSDTIDQAELALSRLNGYASTVTELLRKRMESSRP